MRAIRDRLPPLLGDLYPEHRLFPTTDVNALPQQGRVPVNHCPDS
jgi:hypothetical protein